MMDKKKEFLRDPFRAVMLAVPAGKGVLLLCAALCAAFFFGAFRITDAEGTVVDSAAASSVAYVVSAAVSVAAFVTSAFCAGVSASYAARAASIFAFDSSVYVTSPMASITADTASAAGQYV